MSHQTISQDPSGTSVPLASACVYTDEFYRKGRVGSRRSAQAVVPLVLEYVPAKRVVDVGCGVGAWLSVFHSLGADEVWGVDGEHVNRALLEIPTERFLPFDLTKPFSVKGTFDLAMSLEVAEHLPAASARTFVECLTRLAPVVLFSAAIPFSRGDQHLNEQWPAYWAKLFEEQGFQPIDCLRAKLWDRDDVEWWYAQNIMFYVRRDRLASYPALNREAEDGTRPLLALVHPKNYLAANTLVELYRNPQHLSLRQALSILPFLTTRYLKRKWRQRFGPGGP